jgi:hypothetical protein
MEKLSMGYQFRVPKFQLFLVLYFSQGCLQNLSKVPDSQFTLSVSVSQSPFWIKVAYTFACIFSRSSMLMAADLVF